MIDNAILQGQALQQEEICRESCNEKKVSQFYWMPYWPGFFLGGGKKNICSL